MTAPETAPEPVATLSRRDARRILLDRQGLLRRDTFGRGPGATREATNRIGWVQIDSISVVQRAHHHVLRSRVRNYQPEQLRRLQQDERHLFEYWYHAAAYLPLADYRFYLPVMEGSRDKRPPDPKLCKEILARIDGEGPLSSRAFGAGPARKTSGWWDWKPAKVQLERLFLAGEIMVCHRDGLDKVYDRRVNVLPDHIDTTRPSDKAWFEQMVLSMVDACGLASDFDVGYRNTAVRALTGRGIAKEVRLAVTRLLEGQQIAAVDVAGTRYYLRPDTLETGPPRLGKRRLTFLSPFDNTVINRRRTRDLFDFDYQIECYVPAAKRKYGYFCLPVLFGDTFIGRLDAKADRKTGVLHVKNLQLDSPAQAESAMATMADALSAFAQQNDCQGFRVARTEPRDLRRRLT